MVILVLFPSIGLLRSKQANLLKEIPQILDVLGFEGVSIRSDKPSEAGSGGLLLGTSWFGTSSLGQTRLAYLSLLWKLQQELQAVLLKNGNSLSDFS